MFSIAYLIVASSDSSEVVAGGAAKTGLVDNTLARTRNFMLLLNLNGVVQVEWLIMGYLGCNLFSVSSKIKIRSLTKKFYI
ncbi:hypothetical protein THIOSC15_250002 [uncultured Thiomicrorhabdus sp.]